MYYLMLLKKGDRFLPLRMMHFMKSTRKEIDAIIGASSVTDIYYIVNKSCKDAKQALNHIIDLLNVVNAVDTK